MNEIHNLICSYCLQSLTILCRTVGYFWYLTVELLMKYLMKYAACDYEASRNCVIVKTKKENQEGGE